MTSRGEDDSRPGRFAEAAQREISSQLVPDAVSVPGWCWESPGCSSASSFVAGSVLAIFMLLFLVKDWEQVTA